MRSFWDCLIARVGCGEMGWDEAYQRNNYYRFARYLPGLEDVEGYVLETPCEELPPLASGVVDRQGEFEVFVSFVKTGVMSAYEAAQAYYDAVLS